MDPNTKGRVLEEAVHAIEAVILATAPGLHEDSFRIEARKRVSVAGVNHEIDIWVETAVAKGYSSTFIFECKNWEEAVGKNEIIVFSEKIAAVRATHGYFVAKSFTKDADAQALKDPRMTLLLATEHDPVASIVPESFHVTAPASCKPLLTFHATGSNATTTTPVAATTVNLAGRAVPLKEYLDAWVLDTYADRLLAFWTADLPEGVHPMTASALRLFKPGECVVDGKAIDQASLEVEFGVRISRPPVVSDYEVATRGRMIRFADIPLRSDLSLATAFVEAFDD
jgi:hypothetical protein